MNYSYEDCHIGSDQEPLEPYSLRKTVTSCFVLGGVIGLGVFFATNASAKPTKITGHDGEVICAVDDMNDAHILVVQDGDFVTLSKTFMGLGSTEVDGIKVGMLMKPNYQTIIDENERTGMAKGDDDLDKVLREVIELNLTKGPIEVNMNNGTCFTSGEEYLLLGAPVPKNF